MKATIVDLRYKMNDILKALNRNEAVTVLYHGKTKAIIVPAKGQVLKKIKDHPFFGMSAGFFSMDEIEANGRNFFVLPPRDIIFIRKTK